jgi:hypothetical protein
MDIDGVSNWDLHPDGRRFLATVATTQGPASSASAAAGKASPARHLLLLNWFSELRRLTATAPK